MNETVAVTTVEQRLLLILTWFPLVFAAAATSFRFYARYLKKMKWLWDDWLCLAALMMLFGLQLSNVLATYYGGNGLHFSSLHPAQQNSYLKLRGAVYLIYVSAVATIQASILCFYTRIFGISRPFRFTCYFTLFIVAGWWAATFFAALATCNPIEKIWTPTLPGTCNNPYAICGSTGILHVVLDFFILGLPMRMIWKLQTATSKKAIFTVIFSMGILATICAILRMSCLVSLIKIDLKDPSGTEWMSNLWQIIEVSLGVLCVSLPILPPVWAKVFDSRIGTLTKRLLSSTLRSTGTRDGNRGAAKRSFGSSPPANSTARRSSHPFQPADTNRSEVTADGAFDEKYAAHGDSSELPLHDTGRAREEMAVRVERSYEVWR